MEKAKEEEWERVGFNRDIPIRISLLLFGRRDRSIGHYDNNFPVGRLYGIVIHISFKYRLSSSSKGRLFPLDIVQIPSCKQLICEISVANCFKRFS